MGKATSQTHTPASRECKKSTDGKQLSSNAEGSEEEYVSLRETFTSEMTWLFGLQLVIIMMGIGTFYKNFKVMKTKDRTELSQFRKGLRQVTT